jgi:hypothetical protein
MMLCCRSSCCYIYIYRVNVFAGTWDTQINGVRNSTYPSADDKSRFASR